MANQIEIAFLGLCMLVGESGFEGRHVVLPSIPASIAVNTPRGTTCVEPHVAYISAAEDDVVQPCEACEPAGNGQLLLRVTGHHIIIDGLSNKAFKSDETFGKCVPRLPASCPAFELSREIAGATLDITVGDLSGRQTAKGERSAVWKPETAGGNVVFRATLGGVTRTMTLRPETKSVTIANRYANGVGPIRREPLADNHWLAFYAFSRTSVICDLPGPAADCPVAPASASHGHHPGEDTTVACSNSQYP